MDKNFRLKIITSFVFLLSVEFIFPQSISITSPNGGETWRNGTVHNVTWTHTETIDYVNIEISTDGGSSFILLDGPILNTDSYPWTVPNLDEPDVRIKVSDAALPATNGISDANFRIISPNITSSPVKILPFGDSITSGTDVTPGLTTGDLASYRVELWNSLRINNYNIDFIGSEYFGYDIFPDYQNGGFGGTIVAQIKDIIETGINTKFNPGDIITSPQKYLQVYTPDIVLLHIGTNVSGPYSTETDRENTATVETSRISDVLDDIFNITYNPNANNTWVILALVLNSTDATLSAYYQALNEHIGTMANNRINSGDRILIVDMYNIPGFNYNTVGVDLSDDIHPNSSGYAKMGQVWYNALELILPAGTTEAPTFSQANIDTVGYVGIPFNYQAVASGVGVPVYNITNEPVGMTINQYTGKINWTPNAVADVSMTITASNGTNPDANQNVTIHILQAPAIPTELVSYWRFDENKASGPYTDSYNLNNGYSESPLGSTTGQVNGAYTFDGSDKVNVLDQPEFDFQNSSFSAEAWVKISSSGSVDRAVVGKYGRSGYYNENLWWLGINGSDKPIFFVSFKTGSTRTDVTVTSSTAIPVDTWTHIVGVKNGLTNIKIYVNGVLKTTASTGAGLNDDFNSSRPLNIGHWYNDKLFSGSIDEVAVYNGVLADNTILDHYNRGINYNAGYFDINARIKVFLQGPYNSGSGTMNTTLNPSLIPLTQPYTTAPWNYMGNEKVSTDFFTSNPLIVDWVLVELRTSTEASSTVARRAAFLKSDGTVVDVDGTSAVDFLGLLSASYYIVIKHRNHLAIMSAAVVTLPNRLDPNSLDYDFTTSTTTSGDQFYGGGIGAKLLEAGQTVEEEVWGIIAGDANDDGIIDASDRSYSWNERLQSGYKNSDVTLDGIVDASDRSELWNNRLLQTKVP